MKVLAIGNSFSQDATRYLNQIAKADGTDMLVANLYIGGCALRTHYLNILENAKAYTYEFNGVSTGLKVTVKDALISNDWDVITVQQASFYSPDYKSYQPYLNTLVEYIKKYAPHAKIYVHQTWGYETGHKRLETLGFATMADMFASVEDAYNKAVAEINADGIIKSGKAMLTAAKAGHTVHRDGFHVTLGLGRYMLGLVWYKTLTGNSVLENTFSEFDEPVTDEQIALAKQIAENI